MGFFRDIVDVFSPQARAEKRLQHELRMEGLKRSKVVMKRAWDAADRDRLRGETWLTSQLSVNSALDEDLKTLWDRSEDLCKNDPYASSAVNGRVDNVVGSGMWFHSRIKSRGDDLLNEKDALRLNERRELLFWLWARKDKFLKKQRLFERSVALYGEGLAVMSDIPMSDGRPIPLTWTVINPRRLDTPPELAGDSRVRLGIQFTDDTYQEIEGYWIRDVLPDDRQVYRDTYTFYPRWRVQHSFEEMVPGQIRGYPWLSPAMTKLKDLKDYSETKLIAEQVGACTTTFVSCDDPIGRSIGSSTGTDSGGRRLQEIAPGAIEYIGVDDKVHHVDPNRPGNTYAPYVEHHLMSIAAGLRYAYALLTKDFRSASFANGRLEMADAKKTFECWQQHAIDDAYVPVIERATLEMVVFGLLPNVDPEVYEAFPEAYNAHQFKPPRWRMAVNPLQENKADEVDVDNFFASITDKCDEREADFDDVMSSREREERRKLEMKARLRDYAEELGLQVDVDLLLTKKKPEQVVAPEEDETETPAKPVEVDG